MSESENQAEKSGKSILGIILVLFLVLAGVIAIGLYNNAQNTGDGLGETIEAASLTDAQTNTEEEQTASEENTETSDETQTAQADDGTEHSAVEPASSNYTFDLEKASTPRILGDSNAPVKISEHSSFTCGACGNFHKTNFKQIKTDYIDTGKAYIVFDDFPRNHFDIKIGAIARCVPDEAYFNFLQLLFETQQEWLNDDYLDYVTQNAKLTGASEEAVQACLNSTDLHEAMALRQKAASDDHDVTATPTLIINDTVKVSGLDPYDKIKDAIEAELSKASQ